MNFQPTNCKFYGSNRGCRYGDNCRYSHSNPNSVPLCYHYNCPFGKNCRFRHTVFNMYSNNNNYNTYHGPSTNFNPPCTPSIYSFNPSIMTQPLSVNTVAMNTFSFINNERQLLPSWQTMSSFKYTCFGSPVIRSNNEIIIAPKPCAMSLSNSGLFLYDTKNDQYIEWIKYPINFTSIYYTVLLDKDKDLIYIFTAAPPSLLIINLQNTTSEYIEFHDASYYSNNQASCDLMGVEALGVVVDGLLHFFIAYPGNMRTYEAHYIYYPDTKQLKMHHEFDTRLFNTVLIHIKSENKLLLIRGLSNKIREYDIDKDEWREEEIARLSITSSLVPNWVNKVGHIITRDEQYVILFGGRIKAMNQLPSALSDSIYIMNLKDDKKSMIESHVKCPLPGAFHAFLVDDYKMSDKIVNGYLRRCCSLDNICVLPTDIVNCVCHWYAQEYVHLMKLGYVEGGQHWRILLNDILNEHN